MKLFHSLVASLLAQVLTAQSPCLIASYPFNGNASDATVNQHDGMVFGATLAPDRFGNANSAYLFDGTDDFIKLEGPFTSSSGTVTAWVKLSGSGSPAYPIASWRDTTVNNNALTFVVSDGNDPDPYKLFDGTDLRECGSPSDIYFELTDDPIAAEQWTQVAMTSDGLTVRLYINGQESATHGDEIAGLWWSDLCPTQNLNTYLGYDGRPISTIFYSGLIDDVRIFDCALSGEAIDSLFQSELVSPPCIIANYTFNGNANDVTGNGHNGTVNGASLATDRFGIDSSCYQFNGTSDYIDISGTWTGSNGTISAYIYLDDLDDYRPIFQHDDNDHLGNSFAMNIDCATCQDSSRLWYGFDNRECGGDLYFTNSQPKLEPGAWTHVAMSADETTTHLYINCIEVPTYLYGNNPGLWFDDLCAGPFTTLIGKSVASDGSEFNFKGRIDDLRVYNCALSAEEIAALCDINTATVELAPRTETRAYPNPTTGQLRLSNISNGAVPQVFDATGRKIPLATLQQGSEVAIDLSPYPSGLYVVRVAEHSFSIVRQ